MQAAGKPLRRLCAGEDGGRGGDGVVDDQSKNVEVRTSEVAASHVTNFHKQDADWPGDLTRPARGYGLL